MARPQVGNDGQGEPVKRGRLDAQTDRLDSGLLAPLRERVQCRHRVAGVRVAHKNAYQARVRLPITCFGCLQQGSRSAGQGACVRRLFIPDGFRSLNEKTARADSQGDSQTRPADRRISHFPRHSRCEHGRPRRVHRLERPSTRRSTVEQVEAGSLAVWLMNWLPRGPAASRDTNQTLSIRHDLMQYK